LRLRIRAAIRSGAEAMTEHEISKATAQYNDIFKVQLLTYLRLSDRKLGLVVNFGERLVKNDIHRV
jgi:GxxExxY protein